MTEKNSPSPKEQISLTPLFSNDTDDDDDDDDNGEWFRDKVRAVFEHFDTDHDDHLKFAELAALQKATSGTMLTEEMYLMACRALDCKPNLGITLDALKLTYAAKGSDIEKDYYTLFPDRHPQKKKASDPSATNNKTDDHGETIYEVGADGTVDISL